MTEFNKTNWAKADFTEDYLDKADIYIVERRKMFAIVRSFFEYFLHAPGQKSILDLGCGDGIFTHELLKTERSIKATLIDGSETMLEKARERLKESSETQFIKASFQDIIQGSVEIDDAYDLIASSMAIHHLTLEEKQALFRIIHRVLRLGGFFINVDVLLAPADELDGWYMRLWEEWMDERKASLGIRNEDSKGIIKRYKNLEENNPDLLEDQLSALKASGFINVDCFYKYGIFSIYGGRK
jgi:tRNA (cmo5U34)-methyltransferase